MKVLAVGAMTGGLAAGAFTFDKRAGQHFAESTKTANELAAQFQVGVGRRFHYDTNTSVIIRRSQAPAKICKNDAKLNRSRNPCKQTNCRRRRPYLTESLPLPDGLPAAPSRNCHSEGIRQGCPKNLNCKCSIDLTHGSALLRRQKTIPSHPIPRTIKSWAPASTVSSRASVLCWSFFAFSRRPSAQRAAPSLPAPTPAPTRNRRQVVTIRRSIPTALPCLPAPLLPRALRRIHCSQLFPHNSSVSCLPVSIT